MRLAKLHVNVWLKANRQNYEQLEQVDPKSYAAFVSLAEHILRQCAEDVPKTNRRKKTSSAGRPTLSCRPFRGALDAYVALAKIGSARKAFDRERNAMTRLIETHQNRIDKLEKLVGGKSALIELYDGGAIACAVLDKAIEDMLYAEMSPEMRKLHDLTQEFFKSISGPPADAKGL